MSDEKKLNKLKRPERYVQFESIKPKLKEITEFYTQKVTDYQYRLKQLNEYADALENEISVLKETPKIEVLLDNTLKKLVVVPQIVADFIKMLKIIGIKPLMDSVTFVEIGFTVEKRDEILHWINEHQEEYMRAWLDGYTVEKPKENLYFVKLPGVPTMNSYMCKSCSPGEIWYSDKYSSKNSNEVRFGIRYDKKYSGGWQRQFTEQEIKAIDEHYWAFAVSVEDEQK